MSNAIFPEGMVCERRTWLPGSRHAASIDYRPFFHPLSSLPAYAKEPSAAIARQRNQVAYRLAPWGVNLPSAMNLELSGVERVRKLFAEALATRGAARQRSHG
ncbi:MAG: hypothetical protein U1D30_01375 [Planctomycetota bacterium]